MSLRSAVFNAINVLVPTNGFFALRRWWLRGMGVSLGNNVRVANAVRFYGSQVFLGDDTWIGHEVSFFCTTEHQIHIGARCDVAPGVFFCSGTHEMGGHVRRAGTGSGGDIVVGDGTWVCARATILPGARIGPGTVVAAGSLVVAGEYPPDSLLAGVPAVVKRTLGSEVANFGGGEL